MKFRIVALLFPSFIIGCATAPMPVPIKSNLNDFVTNNTKMNSKDTIAYSFASSLSDSAIQPFGKNKSATQMGGRSYSIPERSSFESMAKNFIEARFSNIDSTSKLKIEISLADFYCEQSTTSTDGQMAMAAFAGGEIPYLLSAYVKAKVTITKDGQSLTKQISTSSDEHFVQGIGTGTNTSNVYRGENGPQYRLAAAIDDANNKAIIFIGKYLEDQQL